MTRVADAYLAELAQRIDALRSQTAQIQAAAAAVVRTAEADGLVYVFGTGHSHMLAEEAHYRAGGLALTVPILDPPLMLHDGAVVSTALEREPGRAARTFARYPIGPKDVVVIVSNSGVNAVPVEAAEHAKAVGATVIAITSEAYSRSAANGRPRLAEKADIVLDNGAPPGDAVVPIADGLRAAPVSTAVGAALLNAVLVEAAAMLMAAHGAAPVYVSANMPGAKETNEALVQRYRSRNPHL